MERFIDWKRESEAKVWFGVPRGRENYSLMILLDSNPERFVLTVIVDGQKIHESEHGCLCEAKVEANEVVSRADLLRVES